MNKIKTILLSSITLLALSTSSNAQAFKQGDNIISLGYGAPNTANTIAGVVSVTTSPTKTNWGPIHAKVEHAVSEHLGIGLSINAAGGTTKYTDNSYYYKYTRNSIKFNARINYHFGHSEKFDPYWGFGVGYGSAKTSVESNDVSYVYSRKNPVPIGLETTLGARYYFTDNIGAYAEVGIAKSIFQAGISFKF